MAGHTAGDPLECYGITIVLQKEPDLDEHGNYLYDHEGKQRYKCGFKIGGGIDQDPYRSPQGYPDKGVYITFIHDNSPATRAGLQVHDKILQVNGHDFTLVTHKKAVEYIKRKPVLNMLVYRKGVPTLHKPMEPQPQFQSFSQPGGIPPQGGLPPHQQFNQYSPNPNSPQPQFNRQY